MKSEEQNYKKNTNPYYTVTSPDDTQKLLGPFLGAYVTIKIVDAITDSNKKSKKSTGIFSDSLPKIKW